MQLQTPHRPSRSSRPRSDPNYLIRQGVIVQLVQARIPRALHKQMKAEAKAADLTLGRWMLETCQRAIERRKRKATQRDAN